MKPWVLEKQFADVQVTTAFKQKTGQRLEATSWSKTQFCLIFLLPKLDVIDWTRQTAALKAIE